MVRPLFGLETEYGVAATTRDGEPVESRLVAAELLSAAGRCLPCVPAIHQGGVFLGNGSRFYVDCGSHPELATPEVSAPEAAVTYAAAGDRILARLADEVYRTRAWRVLLLRGNVDYEAQVTFGRHESYLHRGASEPLAEQLVPHLVSRVIYGAGGLNPKSPGIEFSLSPRSAFFTSVISDSSTARRGIVHTKGEPLAGLGYRRFHVICPGDTLLSQTGTYLHVATTALLVALVDAGERPGDAVRLGAPVAALKTFAADPTGRKGVALERGGSAGALEVQRHYLEWVERRIGSAGLPDWAAAACARWRAILDRLEQGPQALAGTLDWATKLAVYGAHARERGFGWEALAAWNSVAGSLCRAMSQARVDALTCEEALAADSPIRDRIDALTPLLERRGERWERLRAFVDLRAELCEIDTRWGALGDAGIWSGLERCGELSHRIPEVRRIDAAIRRPPRTGRASLRGALIRKAHARGTPGFHADWDRVIDGSTQRIADLSDPFATRVAWRWLAGDGNRRPSWSELLGQETRFAAEHPLVFRELRTLARARGVPAPAALLARLTRRVLAIVERLFPADHPLTAACLRDLVRLGAGRPIPEAAAMLTRAEAIERLNARREALGPGDAEVALACNELGVCLRGLGLAAQAEQVLREAVRIEERVLAADHPRRPHRLNNLASVLLMQDQRDAAGECLERAFRLSAGHHDLTSARILCLRIALAWLDGQPADVFIGQLATLLTQPALGTRANIATSWDITRVLEALGPRLPEARRVLLARIAEVLNDRSSPPPLAGFPEWAAAPAVALDAPWPERSPGRLESGPPRRASAPATGSPPG